jgi:hypothetical protein
MGLEELTDKEILERTLGRDDFENSIQCFDGDFTSEQLIGKTIVDVKVINITDNYKTITEVYSSFRKKLEVVIFTDNSFLAHGCSYNLDDPNTEKFYYFDGHKTFYSENFLGFN